MTAITETVAASSQRAAELRQATVIAHGWSTWHNTVNTVWPESVRKATIGTAAELYDALDLYGALLNEDIHPAAEWHDLAGRDDAYAVALERAAKGVAEWTDELVRVFPACGIVAAPAAGRTDMGFDSKGLDDYIDVAQRIAEFRGKHPEGSLQPLNPAQPFEIRELAGTDKNGKEVRGTFIIYTAAAYRTPDDPRPGVGCAYEVFPGRTPYTAGSELQNAETAAWGRAIVAVLAADTRAGVASQQEVRNRQAERGQSAGDAWEDAAPPRQNGSQQRGQASRPAPPKAADAPPPEAGEIDVDAQAFADEAHGAVTLHDIEDIHRRAREAQKITALVRNPSSDGTGKPGKLAVYLDWKRKQVKELDDVMAGLMAAVTETGFPVGEIETHVKSVTGTDLETANVAQIRHATQVLRDTQKAAA